MRGNEKRELKTHLIIRTISLALGFRRLQWRSTERYDLHGEKIGHRGSVVVNKHRLKTR